MQVYERVCGGRCIVSVCSLLKILSLPTLRGRRKHRCVYKCAPANNMRVVCLPQHFLQGDLAYNQGHVQRSYLIAVALQFLQFGIAFFNQALET